MRPRTDAAFDEFRAGFPAKPCDQSLVRNSDELRLMAPSDGLESWHDGPGVPAPASPPNLPKNPDQVRLWVVRPSDVAHAAEHGGFGAVLESGRIKHSNLTGGAPAHCGGELIMLSVDCVALNGASG